MFVLIPLCMLVCGEEVASMTRTINEQQSARDEVMRPFESSDVEGFLDLYEAVWGRSKSAAWFH
jgi:hypothetical protein